ncbi:MAG: hypothetical protein WBG57_12810 [Ornithinimicrobium sp.]
MSKRWIARALALAIMTSAFGTMLWFAGVLPSSPVMAAAAAGLIAISCALLWWTREDLRAPTEGATWYTVRRDDAAVPPAMDYRLVRLRRDVRDAVAKSSDRGDPIHPLITQLTAQRLRDRHGIDLLAEPERARDVLSEPLATYLSKPLSSDRRTTRRELDQALLGVEQL